MEPPAFQRARSSGHKERRADAFVAAARVVAERDGVQAATLTGIAREVGLHYTSLRRYFPSRDAVMLWLVADGWDGWAGRICDRTFLFATPAPVPSVQILVGTLVEDRLLCELFGSLHMFLAAAGDSELHAFQRQVSEACERITAALSIGGGESSEALVRDLLISTCMIAASQGALLLLPILSIGPSSTDEPGAAKQFEYVAAQLYRLVAATARGLAHPV